MVQRPALGGLTQNRIEVDKPMPDPTYRSESLSDQISTETFLSIKVVGIVPRDQHGIELLVTTQHAKPKTGVSLTVTDVAVYAADSGGRFRRHPAFDKAPKPVRLKKTGGDEAVSTTRPQVYALLSRSPEGSWSIEYAAGDNTAGVLPIPVGVWRFDVVVEWTNLSRPERLHVEVTADGRPRFVRDPTPNA